jgi:hypothetical protein
VLNLLLNAFDAMKDYSVNEREVRVQAEPEGKNLLRVAVCDRGPVSLSYSDGLVLGRESRKTGIMECGVME